MSWDERQEAIGEYVAGRAKEMFRAGDFSEGIADQILEGDFDDAVLSRVRDILGFKVVDAMRRQLRSAGIMTDLCMPVPIAVVRLLVEGKK